MIKELDEKSIKDKNKRIESDILRLNEFNLKKDKFFSIIAHDLKSPIGAMIQLGQVLQDSHVELPSVQRETLIGSISNTAGKTFNLLENLLQWSRSEKGRLTANPVNLNMNEIIGGNINLLRENIVQKKITFRNEINENTLAFADFNMINTVIRNILSNAIKYVHEGGTITFSSEVDFQNDISIIRITDDGFGMDQEVIKKMFDLDSDYTTKGINNESGTGLGLKLCKEFILKNKGDIQVISDLGKGSTFKILLPINDKTATNSQSRS